MTLIILFILLTGSESSATISNQFQKDLQTIRNTYSCESLTTFNHTEITSSTIQKFPFQACGILTINENTDLTTEQLIPYFQNLTWFFGAIRVENSKLTRLPFSGGYGMNFELSCKAVGTSITNNSDLVDISALQETWLWSDVLEECKIEVLDNPKLDASALCESQNFTRFVELKVRGNKKDCGCQGGLITSETLPNYKNYTSIYGGVTISSDTITDDFSKLSDLQNITYIVGNIEISNTSLQNVSFFGKLRKIRSKVNIISKQIILNIHDNPEMVTLGFESLKDLVNVGNGVFRVNFENLHPNFCLTIQEIMLFLSDSNVQIKHLHAKICDTPVEEKDGRKLCKVESLSQLEQDCVLLLGDLTINSDDTDFIDRLKSVKYIFGCLLIESTDLEDLKFFGKLTRIACLSEDQPAITISGNINLIDITMPKLTNILTRDGSNRVIIEDNHPNLFKSTKRCLIFQRDTNSNVTYNYGKCVEIDTPGFFNVSLAPGPGPGNIERSHEIFQIAVFTLILNLIVVR